MMDQIKEMTAVITKADIAMKAATWQIERLMEDVAMLRKALTLSWLMSLRRTASTCPT
jgi:hypothetical protein